MSKFIEAFRREVVAKGLIQDLESKLSKSFIDFAKNAADYASFNVRKLIEKCETFQRLQEVVRQRYSEAQNTLERLARRRRAPSVKRFCDACTTLKKAIEISIKEGDISVELSECLVTGMKILSEPPGKSRCFNKKQRDKIVESSVSFFSSYVEYGKMFYPFVHKMGDFNDLIDIPPCIKAKGNSLHERVADIIFGSPSAGKYNFNGVAFGKLAKSLECRAWPKHPSAALLHCPLEEFFSMEVLYFGILLNANGIRYVLTDPSRMIGCIEKQIRYCKNKPKVIQALQEYNSWETRWGSMLRDAGSDEAKRREYLEKLEKTRSDREEYKMKCDNDDILDMKEIEELQAQVASVTDAQQNGRKDLDYLENSSAPVSSANQNEEDCPNPSRAKKQNISNGKRKRWMSKYAGKGLVRGEIAVESADRNGYTTHFYVSDYRFQLTAGKAGELLDRMIEKQEKYYKSENERMIPFSKGKRNLFKDLKCINPKGKDLKWFFTEIIYLEHDEHGKITRAGFNEALFR